MAVFINFFKKGVAEGGAGRPCPSLGLFGGQRCHGNRSCRAHTPLAVLTKHRTRISEASVSLFLTWPFLGKGRRE